MDRDSEIATLRARLAELDVERESLLKRLSSPRARPTAPLIMTSADVTAQSKGREKIALFRRLFAGRQDVFPLRWESSTTGRSGYSPACKNEWKASICGKPQVKCGECPNQNFIPVSDRVIANHLSGEDRGADDARQDRREYIAGVYPLLPDDTCCGS
jgi:hypothetical protein